MFGRGGRKMTWSCVNLSQPAPRRIRHRKRHGPLWMVVSRAHPQLQSGRVRARPIYQGRRRLRRGQNGGVDDDIDDELDDAGTYDAERGASGHIYYEGQRDWTSVDYALFRYLNRLFLDPGRHRSKEIAALDLARMSAETLHLLKHMLVLKTAYARVLDEYPNLVGLEGVPELDHPLYLSAEPKLVYEYFTEHGIYL